MKGAGDGGARARAIRERCDLLAAILAVGVIRADKGCCAALAALIIQRHKHKRSALVNARRFAHAGMMG